VAVGTYITGVQGDVSKPDDQSKGVNRYRLCQSRHWWVCPLGKVTEEFYDNVFNTNVKGTLFTMQKALPLLNDGGSIILNGSVASVKPQSQLPRSALCRLTSLNNSAKGYLCRADRLCGSIPFVKSSNLSRRSKDR
jgi:NAD(P)-dependent dehydrogenase (short-subunit alcohol dehydrogenase family)